MSKKPKTVGQAMFAAMRTSAPLCDNPSGEWCKACRETGLSHCAHPDECGGMRPMQHHSGCAHGVPGGEVKHG